MKHALDIRIVSNSQLVVDAVVDELPLITDPRIWSGKYAAPIQVVDEVTGFTISVSSIRFYQDVDRDTILSSIIDLNGMFTDCEVGTEIRLHECYDHDEIAGKGCQQTLIYKVTP
ncbi:hypothetical protein KAR91_84770 [Candidatus Pacearchaeota archaeon]|nr:hypothetical protein [Candidatus Pacearchaeota archaeon]